METRSVPTAALGTALELVTAWAWRQEMARVEVMEIETEEGPEAELEVETKSVEIEGRIERRESQERQQMLGQAQTRTNGNPIRGPIYWGTKTDEPLGAGSPCAPVRRHGGTAASESSAFE
jgi:hypothetical protein